MVVWTGSELELVRVCPNEDIIRYLRLWSGDPLVIEKIANMGMTVGASVFETCYWSGRFAEAYDPSGENVHRITRNEVKIHICGTPRAKDPQIRQAIIDRFGGKEKAIGKRGSEGIFYGVKSHSWQALAVGITYLDLSYVRAVKENRG